MSPQTSFDYADEGIKLIDADAHWTEPADLWTSRAPATYKERVPHVIKLPDGRDRWLIEGDKDFGPVGLSVIDQHGQKHLDMGSMLSFATTHPGATYFKERLKYMDEHGIWAQIIYPNTAGFNPTRFMTATDDPNLEALCMQIYNDAAAELQQQSGNRLFPQAMLPLRNMQQAVTELRRVIEDLKLTGVVISDNFGALGLPDFRDPYWDPFWEYVNSSGIPVSFHAGASSINFSQGVWSGYKQMSGGENNFTSIKDQHLAITTIMAHISQASTISNFLFSEIFDKYPRLHLISVESGVGWIPYLLEIAEYQLDETVAPGVRLGKRRPREYFRDHWYVTFWYESFGPRTMLEEIGVKNVMVETDFPHPTCLYPGSREHFNEVLGELPPEVRRRVLQDNAVELFRLPVPATA